MSTDDNSIVDGAIVTIKAPDRRVLRFNLQVTETHTLPQGPVVMIHHDRAYPDGQECGRLEVWIEAQTPGDFPAKPELGSRRKVKVFGTGQLIPAGARHMGSCLDGRLIWHLYDITNAIEEDKR
ncbi:hypothetical protein JTF08_13605 [Micrococcaceae bacterium RIT802]|nr:hypothetical protein [Micrococcaceae bacterium RIT 802]